MTFEYPAQITVTKMNGNGDLYKKCFNGTCSLGLTNKRAKGSIVKRAEAYMTAVEKSLGPIPKVTNAKKPAQLPRLEVVSRVAAIPIVESGIEVTEKVYYRIKESNFIFRWYLSLGEKSISTGVALALPAVALFESPLNQLDRFLCKSLDAVGERVPSIYLPPQELYSETRHFVLKRADSVKHFGAAVLDSRVTAATAEVLDRALSTADRYVDRYLPPDQQDANDVTSADVVDGKGDTGRAKAVQAVQHGARLKRKLQRRLTRQALAEAKAIKEQIHVLVYVAELVAKDPVLAWQKAKEVYASLSQPEPENQARPQTLEELMVLLTRETARKVVHLLNYTHSDLPKNIRTGLTIVTAHVATAADALMKSPTVESALAELKALPAKLQALIKNLQEVSKVYLVRFAGLAAHDKTHEFDTLYDEFEHVAIFLAGNEEREKITPRSSYETRDDLALNGVN